MQRVVLICWMALYAIHAFAESDDWLVLQKASDAARELSYQGIFIYQTGSVAKSVQITHMNFGQGEYARMVVLDGSPREVLSQGHDVVIFNQQNEKVVIEKRRGQNMFPALLPSDMNSVKVSYQVKLGPSERVAGRDAQVVMLDPKDKYRYAYRFWADKEVGLLLKALSINDRNQPMEQVVFSQLNMLNDQKMDWFHPNLDRSKPYVVEESKQLTTVPQPETQDWVVMQVPAGYRKVDQVMRNVPGKPLPVTHLIYSDGLASVSVFIEKLPKGGIPKTGHTVVGATNFYAAVSEGHQIVAVGEVPEATVTEFASAVSFKK